MDAVQDMLKSLREEGNVEEHGEFRLDRDKAREKLSKFQLNDPHAYVLELIQAADLLGATRIFFNIDADEMEMRFDGLALTEQDFEEMYTAAFIKKVTKRDMMLKHFAVAIQAAQALDISIFRIDTAHEQGTLRWYRRGEEEEIKYIDAPRQLTTIYVKERFRASHLLEFWRVIDGNIAEAHVLRKNAKYARIPVVLNGYKINIAPLDRPKPNTITIQIETEYETGWVHFHEEKQPFSTAKLMQNSVFIEEQTFEFEPWSFEALIESSQLNRDLSLSAFVRDEHYDAMVGALYESLAEGLMLFLDRGLEDSAYAHGNFIISIFRWMGELKLREVVFGPKLMALAYRCERIPCLMSTTGKDATVHGKQYTLLDFGVSIMDDQEDKISTIYMSNRRFEDIEMLDGLKVIRPSDCQAIRNYIDPVKVFNVTPRLRAVREGKIQRARWELAPVFQKLDTRFCPFVIEHHIEGVTVYAALYDFKNNAWPRALRNAVARAQASYHEKGVNTVSVFAKTLDRDEPRLLCVRSLDLTYPLLSFFVVGDVEPSEDYTHALVSDNVFKAMSEIVSKVPELYKQLAQGSYKLSNTEDVLIGFLDKASKKNAANKLLCALSGRDNAKLASGVYIPSAWPALGGAVRVHKRLFEDLGAIASIKLFPAVFNKRVSLTTLMEAYAKRNTIDAVSKRDLKEIAKIKAFDVLQLPVLWDQKPERNIIGVLCKKRLVDAKSKYLELGHRAKFMKTKSVRIQPVNKVFSTDDFLTSLSEPYKKTTIQMGLLDPYGEWPTLIKEHVILAEVYIDNRLLCVVDVPCGFGQAMAKIYANTNVIDVSADWTDVVRNGRWRKVVTDLTLKMFRLWIDWVNDQIKPGLGKALKNVATSLFAQDDGYILLDKRRQFLLWEMVSKIELMHATIGESLANELVDYPMFSFSDKEPVSYRQATLMCKNAKVYHRVMGTTVKPKYLNDKEVLLEVPMESEDAQVLVSSLFPNAKKVVDCETLLSGAAFTTALRKWFLEQPEAGFVHRPDLHIVFSRKFETATCSGEIRLFDQVLTSEIACRMTQEKRFVEDFVWSGDTPYGFGFFDVLVDVNSLIHWSQDAITPLPMVKQDTIDLVVAEIAKLWVDLSQVKHPNEIQRRILFGFIGRMHVQKQSELRGETTRFWPHPQEDPYLTRLGYDNHLYESLLSAPLIQTTRGYISTKKYMVLRDAKRKVLYSYDSSESIKASKVNGKSMIIFPGDATMLHMLNTLDHDWDTFLKPFDLSKWLAKNHKKVKKVKEIEPRPPENVIKTSTVSLDKAPIEKTKTPPKPVEPVDPVQVQIQAVCAMLLAVRGAYRVLLDESYLNHMAVEHRDRLSIEINPRGVVIPIKHAGWSHLVERPDDVVARAFLCSTIYSRMNDREDLVTNEHELEYQSRMIAHLLKHLGSE